MASLRLLRHGGPPLEIDADRALVGRDASCDVVLDDKSVSRRHACFERRAGGWAVVDQGSANGTFVDGEPVRDAPLRDGQELRLGLIALRVEIESPPALPMGEGTMLLPMSSSGYPTSPAPPPAMAPSLSAVPPPLAAPRQASPPPMAMPPPVAPPAWGAPESGYGRALTPQEEAANLLGLALNASPQEVTARYEELSADLNTKLAAARTPNLKQTYQKNLDEVRRASEILSPGFMSASVSDLPSATPSVVPEDLDMSMPAPVRAAIAAPAEASAERSGGGPSKVATAAGFLLVAMLCVDAFFGMSRGKKDTDYKKQVAGQAVVNARKDAEKFEPIDRLERAGALKNGPFKVCNKASVPVQVAWVGVVYAEAPAEGGAPTMKLFNAGTCRIPQEWKLVLPPHAETAIPSVSGQDPECHFGGHGLFYGMGLVNPKNADDVVYFTGTLHKRTDCVVVGEGW
jgi:pSer/pThr/pTyr-binding forkhead associated (FHA) protein